MDRRVLGAVSILALLVIAAIVFYSPHTTSTTKSTTSTIQSAGSATTTIGPTGVSCYSNDNNVAYPSGDHGLFVMAPLPGKAEKAAIQSKFQNLTTNYLLNNNYVCGVLIFVLWSSVDNGPGANPRYNWTSIDSAIAEWGGAGKKVSIEILPTTHTPRLNATPGYVLQQANTISCSGVPVLPVFWQQPFISDYQGFMNVFASRYGNNPSVEYIRFGFGSGGESSPVDTSQWNNPQCLSQFTNYGYTDAVWQNYLDSMLNYEKSLGASNEFALALKSPHSGGPSNYTLLNNVSATAARDGVIVGSQGFQISDVNAGNPLHCSNDWCNVFANESGKTPLELQTFNPSDPTGVGQVGSLANLLPFAIQKKAQILEIYYQDWDVAFDPTNANYSAYHTIYQNSLENAANVVGYGVNP